MVTAAARLSTLARRQRERRLALLGLGKPSRGGARGPGERLRQGGGGACRQGRLLGSSLAFWKVGEMAVPSTILTSHSRRFTTRPAFAAERLCRCRPVLMRESLHRFADAGLSQRDVGLWPPAGG